MNDEDKYDYLEREEAHEIYVDGLQDRIAALEAELAALNAPMPCGHPQRYQTTDDEGDTRCLVCAETQALDALESLWEKLNQARQEAHYYAREAARP